MKAEFKFKKRKGETVSNFKGVFKYLGSMRHDKNTAPVKDFIMRDRLLYSLDEKNCLLIPSAYFTYIMSQTQCGRVTAWEWGKAVLPVIFARTLLYSVMVLAFNINFK